MEIFKEKLIEVYVDLEYQFDEFDKILRWIKNNFEKTYNKDADLYFGPTQNLVNLQKSFELYIEQIKKHNKKMGSSKSHTFDEWMYEYTESLCVHAFNESMKTYLNEIFKNYTYSMDF
jgi:hypothetical protein